MVKWWYWLRCHIGHHALRKVFIEPRGADGLRAFEGRCRYCGVEMWGFDGEPIAETQP